MIEHNVTHIDRALIRILQDNGRAPFAQMAREVGISEKTVRKRVGDLIAREVIHIVAVTDPRLLGYHSMAMVGIRLDHSRPASDLAADLAEIESVDYVTVTTGRFNLLVELLASDSQALARTIEDEVFTVSGIGGSEIFPYLRLEYQEPRFRAAPPEHTVGDPPEHCVDEVDRLILAELSADGRVPFQTMARMIGVSEAQVRQRVNRMVDSGAARIVAIANPASLGFRTSAWLCISVIAGTPIGDLAQRIAGLPAITYIAITAGRFDIFAEAVCADAEDLLALIDEHLRPLEGIARVETAVYLDMRYTRVPASSTMTLRGSIDFRDPRPKSDGLEVWNGLDAAQGRSERAQVEV